MVHPPIRLTKIAVANAKPQDFVIDKGNIFNTNSSGGELVMSLTKENGGTRLSSTRYLHYGSVSATCKLVL